MERQKRYHFSEFSRLKRPKKKTLILIRTKHGKSSSKRIHGVVETDNRFIHRTQAINNNNNNNNNIFIYTERPISKNRRILLV